ncbi:zinc-ribbon domain-containing protein [Priestia sp. SB1]|uniref:zinc-ribbon domain-containing protein n=1 Tax=Priestia sp. SB1 TaxID=3132359 RepID=UPI003181F3F5
MLISEKVTIRWHNTTKKYFESKGYIFTNLRDEFEVKVEDLTHGSFVLVEYQCDYCKGKNQTDQKSKMKKYSDLIKMRKTGLDCCGHIECKAKKISQAKLSKPVQKGKSLGERFPDLINQWSVKNNKSPFDFYSGSQQKVWWTCEKGHEYDMSVTNRTSGLKCPYCSSRRFSIEKSLGFNNDKLASEWHPTKNEGLSPYDIMAKTNKKYWWLADCGHEWESSPNNRMKGNGCPHCKNKNSLESSLLCVGYPDIAQEWNYKKNEHIQLGEVSGYTTQKVWWICKEGHEWEAKVRSRTNKRTECPKCARLKAAQKNTKTTDQFKSQVSTLVGGEYVVLSEYESSKVKIRMKHISCDKEYQVTPDKFLSGSRCPLCASNKRGRHFSKTHDQYEKEVFKLTLGEYTILETYMGNKVKITMKHIGCGNEWKVSPDSFLRGSRCPKCSAKLSGEKRAKTHDEFINEVYKMVGDQYIVLSKYKNSGSKVKIRHAECTYEYEVRPYTFIRGARCPMCYGNVKKTTEQFKSEVFDLVEDEYQVLGDYINSDTKIKMIHNICGNEYYVKPEKFVNVGRRCPECYGTKKKTTEQFKTEMFNLVKGEYSVLEEYNGADSKIKIRHNKCLHEYGVTPHKFLIGRRCPMCSDRNNSQGTRAVKKYLEDRQINCSIEETFPECKNKRALPFDFYIGSYNLLIEYDGEQHFYATDLYGGERKTKTHST